MRLVTRAHLFALQTGEPQFAVVTAQFLSLVQTDLGLLDAATQTATEGLRLAESISSESQVIANTHVLGRIELLRGDPRAAAALLRDLPARRMRAGHRDPAFSPWADAIESLIAIGDLDAARSLTTQFESLASRSSRCSRRPRHASEHSWPRRTVMQRQARPPFAKHSPRTNHAHTPWNVDGRYSRSGPSAGDNAKTARRARHSMRRSRHSRRSTPPPGPREPATNWAG